MNEGEREGEELSYRCSCSGLQQHQAASAVLFMHSSVHRCMQRSDRGQGWWGRSGWSVGRRGGEGGTR